MTCPVLGLKREDRTHSRLFVPAGTIHSFIEQISNTRAGWSRDAFASRFPCGAHASTSYRILVLMAIGNIVSACLRCKTGQRMKHIQRCERGSIAGSQNLIRLSSPPDTSRPIVTGHSTRLTSHPWRIRIRSSRPFAKDQTRTAELQEADSMYGLAICRPRCGIVYVGLEILDDPDRTADAMYASA